MTVPGNLSSPLLATAATDAAAAAADITRSLRFNDGDSAYLSRTPSSAGNRKTWTFSTWCKQAMPSQAGILLNAQNGTTQGFANNFWILFYAGTIVVGDGSYDYLNTDKLRDASAWYHVVVACDTTQSSASNRLKIYINGVESSYTGDYRSGISQNSDTTINSTYLHRIGSSGSYPAYFDGYLTDTYLIDGSALAPTSFGAFDDNGVWQATAYSGTYGTNGFHLDFSDNSSNAALGTDSSGNNNTFTVNNLTATTGTTNQGFDIVTWSGNSTARTIGGLNFQPDFVWMKRRNSTVPGMIFNSTRGATKGMHPDTTQAEFTDSGTLTGFTSSGFSVGTHSYANATGGTYIAYCWKAGGSASANTDGTISSTVNANNTYGVSIVTYSGNGSSSGTVGHGLSTAPSVVIVKALNATQDWKVAHSSLQTQYMVSLNENYAQNIASWNGMTSSVFKPARSGDTYLNLSSNNYIAYCFAEKSGFSKFGSYTGNGGSQKITTGFPVKMLIVKRVNNTSHWHLVDKVRGGGTYTDIDAGSADQSYAGWQFDDDGFTLLLGGDSLNGNNDTYIYMAFAEQLDGENLDSLFDVPINGDQADTGAGGEVSGNYAVWNPLGGGSSTYGTFSQGNMKASLPASGKALAQTIFPQSGKWYCEIDFVSGGGAGGGLRIGVINEKNIAIDLGSTANSWAYLADGRTYHNASAPSYGVSSAPGDKLMMALDIDAGKLWYGKNGTWMASGDPANGNNPSQTFTAGQKMSFSAQSGSGTVQVISTNWGQRAWAYTAPSGFKAVCTSNLATPTIADGSAYFDTKLWTGDGSTGRDITGYSFSPDWVWIKQRSATRAHALFDTVRGANKRLQSSSNSAETTHTDQLSAFLSNGFTIEDNNTVNVSSGTYVGWAWDAGSSTVSNTDGSITTSVRASATSGFSIVSWTGTGANGSIGHGLNSKPQIVISKNRTDGSTPWVVDTIDVISSGTNYLLLNSTQGSNSGGSTADNSVVNILSFNDRNGSSDAMIAYCFTSVAGYSAIGTYIGTSDGTFVDTGMRPRWVLIKATSISGQSWYILDAARDPHNLTANKLEANSSNAENVSPNTATTNSLDLLSNGFKLRTTNDGTNQSGATYIYLAIAENPFKANGGLAR